MLDAICSRVLGQTGGVTEATLALNPGLSALGPKLPEGQIITLPDTLAATSTVIDSIRLWD
jgi:phage tail protein X